MRLHCFLTVAALSGVACSHSRSNAPARPVAATAPKLHPGNRVAGDDWRDEQRLRQVLNRFDNARERRDSAGLAAIDAELKVLTAEELHEAKRELERDRAEVAREDREVKDGQKSARQEEIRGDDVAADIQRRELQADRRELKDDVRDLRAEARSRERVRLVREELGSLAGREDTADLNRKRRLIVELIDLAKMELNQNQRERIEDRK